MPELKGFLTEKDREFLRGEKEYESKQGRYARRRSIRERTRGALRDFLLLCAELSVEERDKIFDTDPDSDESSELEEGVAKTIEFLYAGIGGYSGFRQPLQTGVAKGEVQLGNIDHYLEVSPRFAIDIVRRTDTRATVRAMEAGEWDRLDPPHLFEFLKLAHRTGAIDFDAIRRQLDFKEWAVEHQLGKSRRAIPDGKHTPLMDPNLFGRINEMSGEELRALFGEGYPSHSNVVYDGENVIKPPAPGSDEDPEIIERVGRPGDVDVE